MLDSGGGAVVPFGDVHAMAKLVKDWTSDKTLRAGLGEEARKIVKTRYSMDRYVEWLLAQGLT